MKHPYLNLQDYNFWYKSMTAPAPGHIDPVVNKDLIKQSDKVSTMGSCFAQHLSRNLVSSGFSYFVAETSPHNLDESEAIKNNYGVFSARYGNVYTVKQALQLFDRAFGIFEPEENIWKKGTKFVDAYRPQIQVNGFETIDDLLRDRLYHLSCVRKVFLESDWLIFTLGLTECWKSKKDESVFPVAPGVSGGDYNEFEFEFVNFDVNEVITDLSAFVKKINAINGKLKILLTVSPVPLIATYENRHVWVSTTVSKSILRTAADQIEKSFDSVIYFPSYEIITSPANNSRYYADDLRQVTDVGVNHVMRLFSKHFMDNNKKNTFEVNDQVDMSKLNNVVCDEEEIERSVKLSGFN